MRDEDLMDRLRLVDRGPDPDAAFVDRLHDALVVELGLATTRTVSVDGQRLQRQGLSRWARRQRTGRRVAWILVAAALMVILTLGAILVIGALIRLETRISYTPGKEPAACPRFTPPTMECSYLVVPENRSRPDSRTIRVFMARVPSKAAQPALDPLVFVEGPLAIESSWVVQNLPNNPGLARRDLVWISHRGTGSSEPSLACPEADASAAQSLALARSSAVAMDGWSASIRACRDRLLRAGIDISAYGTDDVAADLADARVVLGYASWDVETAALSRVVQTVMRDHPVGLRSVVLDNPMPLDSERFSDALPHLTASMAGLQAMCGRDSGCGSRHPDLVGDLSRQAQAYDAAPAQVSVPGPDGSTIVVLIDGARRWEIARFELADSTRLALLPDEFAATRSAALDAALAAVALNSTVPGAEAAYGAYLSMVCAEELPFSARGEIEAAASSPVSAPMLPLPLEVPACRAWDVGATDDDRSMTTSPIPAVLYRGGLDDRSPFAATQVADHLPASFLLTAPTAADHVGSGAHIDCFRTIRAAFLDNPTTQPDAACLTNAQIAFP